MCKLVRQAVGEEKSTPDTASGDGVMFVRPIHRLAKIDFDPIVATLPVQSAEHASQIIGVCEIVIDRCQQVREVLHRKFATSAA